MRTSSSKIRATWSACLLLALLPGCAAVAPPTGCRCGHCQPNRVNGQALLGDLARTFDDLIVGVDYQEELPPHDIADALAEPEQVPTPSYDLHGPLSELGEPSSDGIPPELGTPSTPMPQPSLDSACEPASHMAPEPPPVVGPPPRFFPVPARPVFAPVPISGYRG